MPRAFGGLMSVILAGALYKALYFPLTWKRGRWWRRRPADPRRLRRLFADREQQDDGALFRQARVRHRRRNGGYKTAKADVDAHRGALHRSREERGRPAP